MELLKLKTSKWIVWKTKFENDFLYQIRRINNIVKSKDIFSSFAVLRSVWDFSFPFSYLFLYLLYIRQEIYMVISDIEINILFKMCTSNEIDTSTIWEKIQIPDKKILNYLSEHFLDVHKISSITVDVYQPIILLTPYAIKVSNFPVEIQTLGILLWALVYK